MAGNYSKSLYNQYEEVLNELEGHKKLLKETNNLVKSLNKTIETLNKTIEKQNKIIEEQAQEILRLKSKNNKDSSNSSKPSSTNGYKKVITNRREKSDKQQGEQLKHKALTLRNKLDNFIKSGNIQEEIIEINKNDSNKNKRYIEKVVIDVKITKHIKRYRYYPDVNGKYNIPKCHNQYVQYGNNIKAITIDLMNNLPNSTDAVVTFISDITNKGITLSKGTLINWNNELSNKLSNEISYIENELLNSYYINHDESQIKIDSENDNVLCACNNNYVRLWPSKNKSQTAIDKIDF